MLDQRCGRSAATTGQPCQSAPARFPDAYDHLLAGTEAPVRSGACVNHMPPEEREEYNRQRERQRAVRIAAEHAVVQPACWAWPTAVPAEPEPDLTTPEGRCLAGALAALADAPGGLESRALSRWQAGRCAVCGGGGTLVEDHDHQTGLTRGLLCRSCNVREGQHRGGTGVFARYRERPPVAILGLTIRYLNPITGEYAMPCPPAPADQWAGTPVTGL